MIVADLSAEQLRRRLQTPGLALRTGRIVTNVRSSLDAVISGIGLLYRLHPVEPCGGFADFHVKIERPAGIRRWWHRQVVFRVDGDSPFAPLPGDQGFPMLEWGMNWCISSHCHQYLIVHAGVVEHCGNAMILPAPPGSGKSTLCAALAFSGWRLLSDELALIEPATGALVPVARPISLKNQSIDVLRGFAPSAVIGPVVHETTKGSVAYVRPPTDSVENASTTSLPRWVVLPRFRPGVDARLEPLSKAQALMQLVDNAFNYHVYGVEGFRLLAGLIDRCDCYTFTYSRLADAAATFRTLAERCVRGGD